MTVKPNFIVIGAARSGTTSLYKYLEGHPDIFMSEIKEINFFSNHRFWQKGMDWYFKHFATATQKAVGEASTSYTAAPVIKDVPKRIKENLGNVKLIYLVRDPIERLASHMLHYIQRGEREYEMSALVRSDKPHDILTQGNYFYQLQQFLEYFEQKDILVINIESLKTDATATVKSIYNFIDVEAEKIYTDVEEKHNANVVITRKSYFGKKVLDFYHKYIEQNRIPYPIKKMFIMLAEIGSTPVDKVKFKAEELKILQQYFEADVLQMHKHYNVDISTWKNFSHLVD